MNIEIEDVKEEFSRDTYWTRIHLRSESNKDTSVLVCASLEYLWNLKGTRHLNDEQLNQWIQAVGNQWREKGDGIFTSPVHYDVYAITDEGKVNGLQFLQTEVVA